MKEGKQEIKRQSGIVCESGLRLWVVSFTLSIYGGQQGCHKGSRGQRQPYLHVWPWRVSSASTSLRTKRENVLKLHIYDAAHSVSALWLDNTCRRWTYVEFTVRLGLMESTQWKKSNMRSGTKCSPKLFFFKYRININSSCHIIIAFHYNKKKIHLDSLS